MKSFIGRAQQISYLTEDQLENLHTREKLRGWLIPNSNISQLYQISNIKERYGIPEDNSDQINHNKRIEQELTNKGFLKTGDFYEENLDWFHAFDWAVFKRAHEIVWDYSGSKRRKSVMGLIEGDL